MTNHLPTAGLWVNANALLTIFCSKHRHPHAWLRCSDSFFKQHQTWELPLWNETSTDHGKTMRQLYDCLYMFVCRRFLSCLALRVKSKAEEKARHLQGMRRKGFISSTVLWEGVCNACSTPTGGGFHESCPFCVMDCWGRGHEPAKFQISRTLTATQLIARPSQRTNQNAKKRVARTRTSEETSYRKNMKKPSRLMWSHWKVQNPSIVWSITSLAKIQTGKRGGGSKLW